MEGWDDTANFLPPTSEENLSYNKGSAVAHTGDNYGRVSGFAEPPANRKPLAPGLINILNSPQSEGEEMLFFSDDESFPGDIEECGEDFGHNEYLEPSQHEYFEPPFNEHLEPPLEESLQPLHQLLARPTHQQYKNTWVNMENSPNRPREENNIEPSTFQPVPANPRCRGDPLNTKNKGYQMLLKLGWTEGNGLGTEGSGIKSPIGASKQWGRMGLGVASECQEEKKGKPKD